MHNVEKRIIDINLLSINTMVLLKCAIHFWSFWLLFTATVGQIGQHKSISSSASINGMGADGNSTFNQSLASAILQASAQSQNSATGEQASISGSASSSANSQSQYCCTSGSENNVYIQANSNGQALAGTLSNQEQVSSGAAFYSSQSQIYANGSDVTAPSMVTAAANDNSGSYTHSTSHNYPDPTTSSTNSIYSTTTYTTNSPITGITQKAETVPGLNVILVRHQRTTRKYLVDPSKNIVNLRSRAIQSNVRSRSRNRL